MREHCNPNASFFRYTHCSISQYKHYFLVILEVGTELTHALSVVSFQEGQKSMT